MPIDSFDLYDKEKLIHKYLWQKRAVTGLLFITILAVFRQCTEEDLLTKPKSNGNRHVIRKANGYGNEAQGA